MVDYRFFDDAFEHYEAALKLDSNGWVAMKGLGICYSYRGKRLAMDGKYGESFNYLYYSRAIDWVEKAIKSVETTPGGERKSFHMRPSITTWYKQLDNVLQAAESARKAYSASKQFCFGTGTTTDDCILMAIQQYIETLSETKSYDELGDLILELDSQRTSRRLSLLGVLLQTPGSSSDRSNLYDKLGEVLRVKDDDNLTERVTTAIIHAAARNGDDPNVGITKDDTWQSNWLRLQVARWILRWSKTPSDSISILETLIQDIQGILKSDGVLHQFQAYIGTCASGLLSQMYFEPVLEGDEPAADQPTKYDTIVPDSISKLKELAMHQQRDDYRGGYPAMLYGIWMREFNHASEDDWRACFLPSIKHAMFLLTDDDPLNDQDAYCELGRALLLAGDDTNASIALGISLKPLSDYNLRIAVQKPNGNTSDLNVSSEKSDGIAGAGVELLDASTTNDVDCSEQSNDDTSKADFNTKLTGFKLLFVCDGPCGRPSRTYKELHFCQYCDDICFCESCVKLLQEDKIPFRVCGSEHPLTRVFPFTPEAKDMVDSLVSRDFEPQAKWLQELGRIWGL